MQIKLKKMKGIDISCASPASTAICSSTDQRSMVRNGTKSIQRLNSYLGDNYKTFTHNIYTHSPSPRAPCISELPFTPRPSSFSSYHEKTRKLASVVKHSDVVLRRNSSVDVSDFKRHGFEDTTRGQNPCAKRSSATSEGVREGWSHIYEGDTTSSHSSRYLLGESKFLDSLNEEMTRNNNNYSTKRASSTFASSLPPSTPVFGSEGRRSCASRVETKRFGSMLDEEKEKIRKHFSLIDVSDINQGGINNNNNVNSRNKVNVKNGREETSYDGHSQRHKSMGRCRNDSLVQNSSSSAKSRDQVVVLRVSLHCKGCEGKLRKHLHKMEGVTSFSIDLETKKVTVVGKVTPLDVLTSISKVKNAQFWPSPASASTTSSSSRSSSSTSTSSIVDYN